MPLAGGWKRGDTVVYIGSGFESEDGTVDVGDVGTVVGPHAPDADKVRCQFPNLSKTFSVNATTRILTEAAYTAWKSEALAGGWKRGDTVVYIGSGHESGHGTVDVGDVGTMVGPHATKATKVMCHFPNLSTRLSVNATTEILTEAAYTAWKSAPLAGGWKRGDTVVFIGSRFENEDGTVDVGDVGTVVGPHTTDAARVKCQFPNKSKTFSVNATTEILTEAAYTAWKSAPLAGGWKRGDTVVYIGSGHESGHGTVDVGDVGTMVGPHATKATKVMCHFPNLSTGLSVNATTDILTEAAYTAWKSAPLAGGWKRGDTVVFIGSRFENGNGTVDVGDVGTVVGTHADAARVKCQFPNKSKTFGVNATTGILTKAAYTAWKSAPLAGGWKRGDTVVFIGSGHESGNGTVDVGDVGTVVGPHADSARVKCQFPNLSTPLGPNATTEIKAHASLAHAIPAATFASAAPLVAAEWSCAACTFLNPSGAALCAMCAMTKSDSDQRSAQQQQQQHAIPGTPQVAPALDPAPAAAPAAAGGGAPAPAPAPAPTPASAPAPTIDLAFAARVCGSDVEDGLSNLNPIYGLADAPDLPLADACESAKLHPQLRTWDSAVAIYAAGKKAKKLAKAGLLDPLSKEEAMALHIYTQASEFYKVFNSALRAQDRSQILPFFPYLKLLLRGLRKLPALDTTVYRGVKLDLSAIYPEDEDFVWWGFTSTTSTIKLLEVDMFCGKSGARSIFAIKTNSAVNVTRYSAVGNENERLIFPGTPFTVSSVASLGAGLTMIQLEQDRDAPSFISGV